ncbi:division/cell wall cluster transcriptional repressor MraZ [Afifella marina]|uniref:Transcriptional regulator MraZ n=1 Tax=Afifella marina DSM 2698 TaxID=1120955 RepID=A0A1G5N3G1_AFIMA|nr:division/cell wall cluster transcriptional repressor MraZ [Afifella marina]MBK1622401.1 division/cell wall cluster transcriptional repressor MraZ [Afifella marina DSM 2698]MBK1626885.1 division/cell wall cluster transcriptional repressor MraZ [Afifella marina]MBK5919185.1 division/cell wall cluster transcriptional repressor MraZ [Afifella marina]RAI21232.1 division/cell wall cluster transcriptional repressor MraZ [Afifella marina DSM 2698]SCZ31882.1 MraZ protein [Afifella marina DSM 2698]
MDGFVATFTNRLDAKGRVSVPAQFRAVLAREGTEGLFCYPSLDQDAIDCGGSRLQDEISKRLQAFETFSEDYETLSTAFYADSRLLKIDQDGRIMLPEEFIEFAGIKDAAVFAGLGLKFQIWEQEKFQARRQVARSRLRSIIRSLDGKRPSEDDA